ncbi:MAG TPA: pilin [Candidatus Wunengus sp. YC60]|uniref:pilin n=1 Tax=Candidatus Wunengus sp. YC60 TaxID=3367697 RepID=UPI00402956C6
MKKLITLSGLIVTSLIAASPVFAQATTGSVTQIQTFIQSVIVTLVTVAGLVSAGFFVWGGITYITSSGNPMELDKAKNTIKYSAIGLAVVLGAYVLSGIITQLATTAFGAIH